MDKSINDLIIEFFKKNPNKELNHSPVVDWVEKQYLKLYNKKPRDPWRGIRKLYEKGFLIKVKKGIYKYNPKIANNKELEDFTPEQKKIIFKRDNYKCVICGQGKKDGLEIHADHIIPKNRGGKATVENGQTLCSIHNLRKKNFGQTESGKKMFIRLWETAIKVNDVHMISFCEAVLSDYEKFNINGHIKWKHHKNITSKK